MAPRWLAHRGAALSWDVLDAVAMPREMGIKRIPDFNTGATKAELFPRQPEARPRWSSARGFLKPAEPSNLRLEKHCWSTVSSSSRAAPSACASFRTARSSSRASASDPLGRLDGSVQVLHRSGIGPQLVIALGIDIVMDKPHRPQSAGPSPAARDLQGRGCAHAERDLLQSVPPRLMGLDYAFVSRATDHGTVATRHLHALRCERARANIQFHVQRCRSTSRRSPASLPAIRSAPAISSDLARTVRLRNDA